MRKRESLLSSSLLSRLSLKLTNPCAEGALRAAPPLLMGYPLHSGSPSAPQQM